MSLIKKLVTTKPGYQTVFTLADIGAIVPGYTKQNLFSAVSFALKSGDLIRLAEGIYSLNKNYRPWELANKYISPSYVSLYSILAKNGVVFQPYTSVYLVANKSKIVALNGQQVVYKKMKLGVLLNPLGIENQDGVMEASKERAIADLFYLKGEEYFDNLRMIDWELLEEINEKVFDNMGTINRFIRNNR